MTAPLAGAVLGFPPFHFLGRTQHWNQVLGVLANIPAHTHTQTSSPPIEAFVIIVQSAGIRMLSAGSL